MKGHLIAAGVTVAASLAGYALVAYVQRNWFAIPFVGPYLPK